MNPFAKTFESRPQLELETRSPSIPKPKFVAYPTSPSPSISNSFTATTSSATNSTSQFSPSSSQAGSDIKPPKPLPTTIAPAIGIKTTYKSKRVFKVIIIGDAGVGKTCLSFRFCNGRFPHHTEATIGVDFRERSLVLDGELIRVQLWDTAGQERYRQSIVSHYYRNVNAVVFVYDVTNPTSFRSLSVWIQECQKHALGTGSAEDGDLPPHILIGNKCDLDTSTTRVRTDQAQIFADENDMAHFETSALADSEADHVESIFMTLVHKLRHSKAMHVQSSQERNEKDQKRLLLKAGELNNGGIQEGEEGWCC